MFGSADDVARDSGRRSLLVRRLVRRCFGVVACAIALGPTSAGQATLTRLAEVPAGIEIASELEPTSHRGTWIARPSLAWSKDGKRVAYAGLRGDSEWLPIVGDAIGEPYDYVGCPVLAGGHAFFHVVRTVSSSRQESWMWIDGNAVGPEDWLGEFAVEPAGRRAAFWVHPGARIGNTEQTKSNEHFLTILTEKQPGRWSVSRAKDEYIDIARTPPLFTADGRRVFSFGWNSKGWFLLQRSGSRVKELTKGQAEIVNVAVSPDGKALAYAATRAPGGSPEVFFRGKSVGHTRRKSPLLAVGPKGKRVAYVVGTATLATAAVNGEKNKVGSYDHVLELSFDPDGERLAFVANVGGAVSADVPGPVEGGASFVVVRPAEGEGEWDEASRYLEVRDLVWSPDGSTLAYCAREDEGWRVIAGSWVSAAFDYAGPPVFSEDGSRLGFGVREGRVLSWGDVALK